MADEENTGSAAGNFCKYHWKGFLTLMIPVVFSPILLIPGLEFRCLFLVCVMALYWITEVIPLYVTSLIPIVLLPPMGIVESNVVCIQYFKTPLVMFLGGLMVALAIEYSNLHKRLALKVILLVGCSPRRLHLGLIFVTMFISMWISNSATTAMMCPIIRAILEELGSQNVIKINMEPEKDEVVDRPHPSKIAMAYYLGMAYAASIGGCGTLIGTATNITFKGLYEGRFPDATEKIDFPIYMSYSVPLVVICTICTLISVQFTNMGLFRPNSAEAQEVAAAGTASDVVKEVIKKKYDELGPMTCHEIQVVILFLFMVVLLLTMSPGFFHGWADVLNAVKIKNSAPVMFIVVLLFLFPINYSFFRYCCGSAPFPQKEIPSLIAWKFCHDNIPWGLVFLLGGGYALAEGSKQSGMAKMLGEAMHGLASLPISVVQGLSVFMGMFMTAFSSNVAICNIIIPILCELAVAIRCHPLYLVFPAGLACSMAFHLPVSTPPNAIVSGYANIKTKYMAVCGILPSLCTITVLCFNGQFWHRIIYPNSDFPEWALHKVNDTGKG